MPRFPQKSRLDFAQNLKRAVWAGARRWQLS
ncbi:MAG: hypothetical protein RL077_2181 [Verrucomicrobiota bacterium]|jgi:hypothetical protein